MPASPDAAILRNLRGGFVPGEELGDPAEIAARIALLIEAGYEIEHHPHRGYHLLSSPDRLIADDILSRLPEGGWIRDVLVFEKTGSTNDVVGSLARQGAPAGLAVFAEEQTAGRGRLGRRWQSASRAGLWFSVLLRPEIPVAQWPRLTLWIAFAVSQSIREFAGLETMLKWPNDIYAYGRKLAGILVESSPGDKPFAIAGVGLNVNQSSFPPPLDTTATSLKIETDSAQDRNALAAAILASFEESISLVSNDFHRIMAWASEADCLRGRWVSAATGASVIEGIAEGLDREGALLIRTGAGALIPITGGEVTRFSANG